jgi:hypothetical protein
LKYTRRVRGPTFGNGLNWFELERARSLSHVTLFSCSKKKKQKKKRHARQGVAGCCCCCCCCCCRCRTSMYVCIFCQCHLRFHCFDHHHCVCHRVYAITLFLNNIIPRVLFSGGHTPRITFSHAKQLAYAQPSFPPPPPPQQGCRRCAPFPLISVFVIISIVIAIVVAIAIIASRGLLSAGAPHITRACTEGHPNNYAPFSPPSPPLQGSRRWHIFYLISVLVESGFRFFL